MNELKMKMRLEREMALTGAQNDAYLFLEVEAPEDEGANQNESKRLELALVLDVSGSMAGAPIEAAKEAARRLVTAIGEKDRLMLVTFDADVKTVCGLMEMNSTNRNEVTKMIDSLEAGSTTHLHGGWQEAATGLLEGGPDEETIRRIVLLSDGHANVGTTDPTTLGHEAGQMAAKGVYTSCVGIGNGYSTVQLQALAESGGGRLHDAERPHEIVEVVTAELREVVRTTAENVRFELGFPPRAHVTCLSGYPAQFVEGAATFQLGSMMASGKREAVLRLRFSDRFRESDVQIHGAVRWRRPGEATDLVTGEESVKLRFGPEAPTPRSEGDSRQIAKALLAYLVRAVTELNREHSWRGLRRLARHELLSALELCEPFESLHGMAGQLVHLFSAARRPLQERSRKEMALAHYKGARMEEDYRRTKRAHWAEHLDIGPESSLSATIEDVKRWMSQGDEDSRFRG